MTEETWNLSSRVLREFKDNEWFLFKDVECFIKKIRAKYYEMLANGDELELKILYELNLCLDKLSGEKLSK